jgi:hypothetical protein
MVKRKTLRESMVFASIDVFLGEKISSNSRISGWQVGSEVGW